MEEVYLEDKRTIFDLSDENVDYPRHIFGFIVFMVIFVICIPYLLIKGKYFALLSAYFPNLDLIASILGYHGGPGNSFIWYHLYNPADSTLVGYITSNIINFFALLGVTFVIAYYTLINKNIYMGWSRAFITLLTTYFIPSNIVIYYMNRIGRFLNKFYSSKSHIHYLLVVISGLIMGLGFIVGESFLIKELSPIIVNLLNSIY